MSHPAREPPDRLHLLGLPELVLELLALGDVHHGADHPHGLALAVVQHVPPVEHVGVGAVDLPVSVFRAPALRPAVDRGVDVGHDAVPILGVDVLVPPRDVGADLLWRVAEDRGDPLVPPQRVAHQVPVPHRVVGGARHELEALLALPEGPDQPFGGAARQLLVREQLGVANREGGLGGQPDEDRLVLVGERAGGAVVHVEQALDAVLDEHRHRHLGTNAEPADALEVAAAQPGVLQIVTRA